jgi:hypothetical protein
MLFLSQISDKEALSGTRKCEEVLRYKKSESRKRKVGITSKSVRNNRMRNAIETPWAEDFGSEQPIALKRPLSAKEDYTVKFHRQVREDVGDRLLGNLNPTSEIYSIWKSWKDCKAHIPQDWPQYWRPQLLQQYIICQDIGLEIERRSGGDKSRSYGGESRVSKVINEMEKERKSYKNIQEFADFLFETSYVEETWVK